MTFNEAKHKLDKMTEKQLDKYGVLLAKLHKKIEKTDKTTAYALELSLMAMALYCEKEKK